MAKHDYDLIIIGGGAAGLTVAAGAAQLGVKTALIEKKKLGGDCLHYGCVPSKTLIKSGKIYHYAKNMKQFGLPQDAVSPCDIKKVMKRVEDVIEKVGLHDSEERFTKMGIKVIYGQPEFTSERELVINGKRLSASKFVISTGSSPMIPPIEGLKEAGYITNTEVFSLKELPKKLLVVGGGPIGVEMAQALSRLGSRVTIVDLSPNILDTEDRDMSKIVAGQLLTEGIDIICNSLVNKISLKRGKKAVMVKNNKSGEKEMIVDEVLVATGRAPNVNGLNLEKAGVKFTKRGIETNLKMETSQKHIYAAGDVNGKYFFTHMAGAEGSMVVRNAVLHIPGKINYMMTPWTIFTDPEIASIGYSEKTARKNNIEYDVYTEVFEEVDRAFTEGETRGRMKILTKKNSTKIIGTQIVGMNAGEIISGAVLALNKGMKLSDLATPVFAYPTLSEINKKSAGKYYAEKIFSEKTRKVLKLLFGYNG